MMAVIAFHFVRSVIRIAPCIHFEWNDLMMSDASNGSCSSSDSSVATALDEHPPMVRYRHGMDPAIE
jgi:hypothetical protein